MSSYLLCLMIMIRQSIYYVPYGVIIYSHINENVINSCSSIYLDSGGKIYYACYIICFQQGI
jgi:hypothetical protein